MHAPGTTAVDRLLAHGPPTRQDEQVALVVTAMLLAVAAGGAVAGRWLSRR